MLIAVLIVLLVVVFVLIAANIRIVPQAHAFVIEHLGKYKTTWQAGLHVKTPFIERVIRNISLIFDPKLYTYGVDNPIAGLQNLSATTLRNIIGDMELDETLTSREIINSKMQTTLDEATDPWGIKVTRVEIKNIQPPREIEEVMTKQMRAERERRQTVLEAQAHQEAVVSRAEGDKRAKILAAEAERDAQIALAEGRARSIELVYKAEADGLARLSAANPSDKVIRLKGLEALKTVSDGRATKIYMPSDLTGVIGALGVAGEALGIGDATAVDKTPKPQPPVKKDPCISDETGNGGRAAAAATEKINEDITRQAGQSGI